MSDPLKKANAQLEKMEQKRKRNSRLFNRLFVVLAYTMFALELFLLGWNLGHDNTQFAISNGILALFWAGAIFVTSRSWKLDVELDYMSRDLDRLKSLMEFATEIAEKAAEKSELSQRDEELAELAHAIYKDVTNGGGRKPTAAEIARIEQAFHDQSDGMYLKCHVEADGMGMEISSDPIEHVPGRSEAHEAARKRGNAARAKSDAKPLTKSQQRRINAQKGYGPITDEELREKRNAERRAKRAAKKAETTTSTTTQPGQLELPVDNKK